MQKRFIQVYILGSQKLGVYISVFLVLFDGCDPYVLTSSLL